VRLPPTRQRETPARRRRAAPHAHRTEGPARRAGARTFRVKRGCSLTRSPTWTEPCLSPGACSRAAAAVSGAARTTAAQRVRV